jgi:hypothetical protein
MKILYTTNYYIFPAFVCGLIVLYDNIPWQWLGVIEVMGMDLLPYIVLLVVPILGRMSDQNEAVRLMATHCFATLIRLMPLEVRFSVCYHQNEV